MFIRDAIKLCPDPVVLPCQYDKYEQASLTFFQVLLKYTHRIQPVSADEAFLDLREHGDRREEVVRQLRADVLQTIGCPCSAGIGMCIPISTSSSSQWLTVFASLCFKRKTVYWLEWQPNVPSPMVSFCYCLLTVRGAIVVQCICSCCH
jgi:hypothetical protein